MVLGVLATCILRILRLGARATDEKAFSIGKARTYF